MPTAIIKIHTTSSGFLLASDGRGTDNKGDFTDNEQKVFQVGSLPLGYALTGPSIKLFGNGTDRIVFDFVSEFQRAANLVAEKYLESSSSFLIGAIGKEVYERFVGFQEQITPKAYSLEDHHKINGTPNYFMLTAIFCGYHNGEKIGMELRFYHENRAAVSYGLLADLEPVLVGSIIVQNLLFGREPDRDGKFSAFRRDFMTKKSVSDYSLDEAIEYSKCYIDACNSDEGRSVDPIMCDAIGGRVQIANITPDGFQWLTGYEPLLEPLAANQVF
jgi:hypothetical protein